MDYKQIKQIIKEEIVKAINETGFYSNSSTPLLNKTNARNELGLNPLRTDVGNRSANDEVGQPSTYDKNGIGFKPSETYHLSKNKFMIYKLKNYGNPDVKGTISFFGNGAEGEKNFRRNIDALNGAADRASRSLYYRVFYNENDENFNKSFWEYSFDGVSWYLLLPNAPLKLKKSEF